MKSNKFNQGLATSLTALATAMLCQTTATYASDIEIYKAPTQGGATLMLALDFSTSMSQARQTPINTDFELDTKYCRFEAIHFGKKEYNKNFYDRVSTDSTAWYEEDSKTYLVDGESIKFTARYCDVPVSATKPDLKDVLDTSCKLINKKREQYEKTTSGSGSSRKYYIERKEGSEVAHYKCPDRVTALKQSVFDMIMGGNNNAPLPSTTSLGFTIFPKVSGFTSTTGNSSEPSTHKAPLPLNSETNKKELLKAIATYGNNSNTPVAQAYAVAAKGLHDHITTSTAACAGYGVYFLTDGEPYNDKRTDARNTFNSIIKADSALSSTQCDGNGGTSSNADERLKSWQCTTPMADLLKNKKNTNGVEIKTAIVGFGKEFRFTNKSDATKKVVFDPEKNYTVSDLEAVLSGRPLEAAKTAIAGGGGWYSPDSTADIVASIEEFVESIKVPIPAITTGTSSIPQDALNSSVVQPYAYFPQFQPTPSEMTQAWVGNLKKYKVIDGLLKDKADRDVFSSAGVLNLNAEDLWVKNYAANTNLTETQQKLKNLGGLLGRLNLKTDDGAFNRKVYTNAGQNVSKVNKAYIEEAPTSRGYFLGLLGYQIPKTEVDVLTAAQVENIVAGMTPKDELRQMGAILHSTPVLLTQSGKITFTNNVVDTTNRDDYILVGTTQGALHVIKAGTHSESAVTSIIDNTAGEEVFTFVPEEMLSSQPEALLAPTETPTAGMENLFYGVDGQWVAHTEYVYIPGTDTQPEGEFKVYHDDNKYGKQWVYGGMRMGGKSYYALDLTRLTATTDNGPKVKFRINPDQSRVDGFTTPSAESTRYANLSKMGQSWSKPTIANVQWKGKRRLVMFVGGGYDPDYENFDYDQTNGMGAGVYMFDADTGEFLWSTYDAKDTATGSTKTLIGDGDHLKYSVVSQIKTVDRDGDGDVDHLYFGDLGGQVFRVDLDKDHPSSGTYADYAKQITRIYNGNTNNDKFAGYSPRFYEMPTFTVYGSGDDLFAVVSIGSGNRSTPLLGKVVNGKYVVENEAEDVDDPINSNFINDAIYNIYDKVVTQEKPHEKTLGESPRINNLHALTDAQRELAATSSTSPTPSNLATWKEGSTLKGWYYPFTSSANIGTRKAVEKVQGELIAIDNDLYVSTFDAEGVGTTEACGAGIYGNSRAHRFCMPYGQCANGDTVADNTVVLGKGLLGITVGPGSSTGDRRIIAPLNTTMGNKITSQNYKSLIKLTPQSWYEKN
ncbi:MULTISPECIES: PilC/PilY family type IV pilus protein [unclassified Acinetobacter]|uniref:PilC/PilY family type IV pilus protein n=1 Tax=unclassified Acinetobacter TaxID=196816 RepID=UPI0015D29EBF|nr:MULTISPECIES: PilC/PilY family type IV pilus protein [unclassified Acinetobacter]